MGIGEQMELQSEPGPWVGFICQNVDISVISDSLGQPTLLQEPRAGVVATHGT